LKNHQREGSRREPVPEYRPSCCGKTYRLSSAGRVT
jgi:hypothetical protein